MSFEFETGPAPSAGETPFLVDVEGYEGPLDLLLSLARSQKIDLTRLSMSALAEQYLAFIREARRLRLELAADYLVMAAWLAYLKSRLLIPVSEDEEPTGEELAAALAFRLRRLEAMREAAARLVNRDRLGRDVFARGLPEPTIVDRTTVYEAELVDLLRAYADQCRRRSVRRMTVARRRVWSATEAREVLLRLVGGIAEWTPIDRILVAYLDDPELRASVLASSFSAALEMVRDAHADLRQDRHYAPLMMRARPKSSA